MLSNDADTEEFALIHDQYHMSCTYGIEQEVPWKPENIQRSIESTDFFEFKPFRANAKDCFIGADSNVDCDPRAPQKPQFSVVHHHHHYPEVKSIFLAPPLIFASAPSIYLPDFTHNVSNSKDDDFKLLSMGPIDTTPVFRTDDSAQVPEGPICSHCQTEATSLWRRVGERLMCNACALYFKLHGVQRPLHLNTGIVKRRNRVGSAGPRRQRRYKC